MSRLEKAAPESARSYESMTERPGRVSEPIDQDIVEVWGLGSFPASDPPANW